MIAESIYNLIPQWLVPLNHQSLTERNPNIIDDQASVSEILDLE